jgi:hypothetical protein
VLAADDEEENARPAARADRPAHPLRDGGIASGAMWHRLHCLGDAAVQAAPEIHRLGDREQAWGGRRVGPAVIGLHAVGGAGDRQDRNQPRRRAGREMRLGMPEDSAAAAAKRSGWRQSNVQVISAPREIPAT